MCTEMPSISPGAGALEMALSFREKLRQRRETETNSSRGQGTVRGQETVCDLLDKQIGLQAKWIKRLS